MKKITLTLAFLCIVSLSFAEVSPKEKQALLDFYNATNGPLWNTSWNVNTPVAEWQGVTVENNTVTGISLLFNNIDGELPSTFGNLENLSVLELSFNKLSGKLPNTLGNLKHLEILALSGNQLEGTIPESIGKLQNLKTLHLSSNLFSGTLPKTVGNLANIEIFNVFDNKLSGEIPSKLTQCKHLKELAIAQNKFTNTNTFSVVLLSNTGSSLDLSEKQDNPIVSNTVIALETGFEK